MRRITTFLLIIMYLGLGKIVAQEQSNYVIGKNVNLHSKILSEDRSLSIYLPKNY